MTMAVLVGNLLISSETVLRVASACARRPLPVHRRSGKGGPRRIRGGVVMRMATMMAAAAATVIVMAGGRGRRGVGVSILPPPDLTQGGHLAANPTVGIGAM